MRRGEIYRVHYPGGDPTGNDPKLYRSFVVVSRQVLVDSRFPTVVCAPILTRGHGFSTQVSVGIGRGAPLYPIQSAAGCAAEYSRETHLLAGAAVVHCLGVCRCLRRCGGFALGEVSAETQSSR